MFTDMVGCTVLGQRNESLSLALVEEQRNLVRPILSQRGGREVKTMVMHSSSNSPTRWTPLDALTIYRELRESSTYLGPQSALFTSESAFTWAT
jgi:hypothetical protein